VSRSDDPFCQNIAAGIVFDATRVGHRQERDMDWLKRPVFIERQ
jgi:hypothetical protein